MTFYETINLRAVATSLKSKNYYDLRLFSPRKLTISNGQEIEGKCWPISLKMGLAQRLSFPKLSPSIMFHNISIEHITSLFGFELTAKWKSIKHSIRFVLNLPLQGMPRHRDEKILQKIVSNRESFIRYLLLLLREGEFSHLFIDVDIRMIKDKKDRKRWSAFEDIPLFEELVRAFSRNPEKIERISKLIEDVSKVEGGERVLPEGFMELWDTFKQAKYIRKSV